MMAESATCESLAPLIVVSGPSGVGKSTIVRSVLEQDPQIWLSVSATTRTPRPGEIDGVDYHFVSDAEFDALVESGGLLEWATYAGNRYGTPAEPVHRMRAQGHPVILEIEVQGARTVRATAHDAVLVFIAPPDTHTLRERLVGRGTEDPQVLAQRMEIAASEMEASAEFDRVLVNSQVGECAGHLLELLTDLKGITPQG
jgi:guanylate kinase